jgi:hypothetical protein
MVGAHFRPRQTKKRLLSPVANKPKGVTLPPAHQNRVQCVGAACRLTETKHHYPRSMRWRLMRDIQRARSPSERHIKGCWCPLGSSVEQLSSTQLHPTQRHSDHQLSLTRCSLVRPSLHSLPLSLRFLPPTASATRVLFSAATRSRKYVSNPSSKARD